MWIDSVPCRWITFLFLLTASFGCGGAGDDNLSVGYTGSQSCRNCHERFYELWSTSHHGLAMQPVTEGLLRESLSPLANPIEIQSYSYEVVLDPEFPHVVERGGGEVHELGMKYALGGKNIYYFLTERDRGWLQVLPIAFDVRAGEWYDTTASMVRHFADQTDEPIHWTERPLTFNTACYGCHISQLAKNYDPETDSYATTWVEPGINCETCHGQGGEHVRVCTEAPEGSVPDDLKIILTSAFTVEQTNSMCAPCHAKMNPITESYLPGDRYFDHFNLHTLEHPDFYPDGRDLGENYTYTQWLTGPCADSGELDCVHCHTSSGRTRQTGAQENEACLPCHAKLVDEVEAHSHHPGIPEGNSCISCHMPSTFFAKMERHDHSMLPPVPAATVRFGSPNACNLCHEEETPEWADEWVRKWYARDYQEPFLVRGELVKAARARDWSKLDSMLGFIGDSESNSIFVASLIRLLQTCPDNRKWPVLIKSLEHESPLVRAAAATVLEPHVSEQALEALLGVLDDEFRLVRIQAAAALAAVPPQISGPSRARQLAAAMAEYESALKSRPDDWTYLYNLGNLYSTQGQFPEALAAFERSSLISPDSVPPLVNRAMVFARLGQNADAEKLLLKALAIEPRSAETNFNLGLLVAEEQRLEDAERYLRKALEADPSFAEAAYNLGILLAGRGEPEGLVLCRKAAELRPDNARYTYTLAFYLIESGELNEARSLLEASLAADHSSGSIYSLLWSVYDRQKNSSAARKLLMQAARDPNLSSQERAQFEARLQHFR